MTWPNGSVIYLFGADKGSADSYFRGSKWDGIHIDECQEFRFVNMHSLIFQSIKPALDERKGFLFITGTPGPSRGGFFYDIMIANKYPLFKTFYGDSFNNPFVAEAQRAAVKELMDSGIDIDNTPWIQREYFAKWVEDDRLRVICLNPSLNYVYHWNPHQDDKYILGIDFAFTGVSAYVIAVENRTVHPNKLIYLDAYSQPGMKLAEHADLISKYRQRYNNLSIVGDTAGPCKTLVDDLQTSYGIPIIGAQKADKRMNELRLNNEAQVGKIGIFNINDAAHPENSQLVTQWNELQKIWKRGTMYDADGNAMYSAAEEWDVGEPRHIHDAALYARNFSTISFHEPTRIKPVITEGERMRRSAMSNSRPLNRTPARWRMGV